MHRKQPLAISLTVCLHHQQAQFQIILAAHSFFSYIRNGDSYIQNWAELTFNNIIICCLH